MRIRSFTATNPKGVEMWLEMIRHFLNLRLCGELLFISWSNIRLWWIHEYIFAEYIYGSAFTNQSSYLCRYHLWKTARSRPSIPPHLPRWFSRTWSVSILLSQRRAGHQYQNHLLGAKRPDVYFSLTERRTAISSTSKNKLSRSLQSISNPD